MIRAKRAPEGFFILPETLYPEAMAELEKIRSVSRDLMSYEMQAAAQRLTEKAVPATAADLTERSYGSFGISHTANAWRGGKLLTNHGEVYIYAWQYRPEDKVFTQGSAWGGVCIRDWPDAPGTAKWLLLELPGERR